METTKQVQVRGPKAGQYGLSLDYGQFIEVMRYSTLERAQQAATKRDGTLVQLVEGSWVAV